MSLFNKLILAGLICAIPVAAHATELEEYETSKGMIRFTPEKPLPAALVKKIVKERLKENAAKAK